MNSHTLFCSINWNVFNLKLRPDFHMNVKFPKASSRNYSVQESRQSNNRTNIKLKKRLN